VSSINEGLKVRLKP